MVQFPRMTDAGLAVDWVRTGRSGPRVRGRRLNTLPMSISLRRYDRRVGKRAYGIFQLLPCCARGNDRGRLLRWNSSRGLEPVKPWLLIPEVVPRVRELGAS